jgi:hypothetical protein
LDCRKLRQYIWNIYNSLQHSKLYFRALSKAARFQKQFSIADMWLEKCKAPGSSFDPKYHYPLLKNRLARLSSIPITDSAKLISDISGTMFGLFSYFEVC